MTISDSKKDLDPQGKEPRNPAYTHNKLPPVIRAQWNASSTPIAANAEPHETINDNGIMKMPPAAAVPIPAHEMVTFAPGGTHIMLMGLKQPLTAGQSFLLTLTFAHSAPVTVDVKIRGLGRGTNGSMSGHDGMQMR